MVALHNLLLFLSLYMYFTSLLSLLVHGISNAKEHYEVNWKFQGEGVRVQTQKIFVRRGGGRDIFRKTHSIKFTYFYLPF